MKVKHFLTAAVATTAFALAGTASGQEWKGGTSNDWYTASNWDPPTVPNATTADVTIGVPTTHHPVLNLADGNTVIGKLTIEGGGFLTVLNTNPQGEKLTVSTSSLDGSVTVKSQGRIEVDAAANVEVQGPTELQAGTSNPGGLLQLQDDAAVLEFKGLLTTQFHASNPGRLQIGDNGVGGMVVFTSNSIATPHALAGRIDLVNANSRLRIAENTAFGPDGSDNYGIIVLDDADARIQIERHGTSNSTIELRNQVTIEGFGVIEPVGGGNGMARLLNHRKSADARSGVVAANVDGETLLLADDLRILDMTFMNGDTYRPEMRALNGGKLYFDGQIATSLEANFVFDGSCADSEFVFDDADIVTAGELQGSGFVVILNSGYFEAANDFFFASSCFGDCCP